MINFLEKHIICQQDNQLYHKMIVTNISNSDKTINTIISLNFLYSISNQEYVEKVTDPYIDYESYQQIEKEAMITLKPQEDYLIIHNLSVDYIIPSAMGKYALKYFPNMFDTLDESFEERMKKQKSITFTWHQYPDTNTGYLVGDVIYPSE